MSFPLAQVLVFGAVVVLALAVISIGVAAFRFRRKPEKNKAPRSVLVVLGSGGHTSEMLALVAGLDKTHFDRVVWVVADSDKTSLPKLEREKGSTGGLLQLERQSVEIVPRSREVGQTWLSSIFTTAISIIHGHRIVFRNRPTIILMNGPGTCVPLALGGISFRILAGGGYPRLVFIESFCRVKTLSLTGKVLYRLVDRFVVQWSSLQSNFKRSEYAGVIF